MLCSDKLTISEIIKGVGCFGNRLCQWAELVFSVKTSGNFSVLYQPGQEDDIK